MVHHLFLSPHFDDAIGSCGGIIWRLVSLGHPVLVLTAFGGLESEQLSMPARVLHEEWKLERPVIHRRLEDASACGLLGCHSSFLDFPDAIYRRDARGRHLYPTFESLRGSLANEDRALAQCLATQLHGYLSDENSVVYCPMAIGGHVDHVVVRDCGRLLEASRGSTVAYYRDFYYDRTRNDAADDRTFEHVSIVLTPEELEKKIAAFSEYESQLSDLFESHAGMLSYFTEVGKSESIFLPRQQIETRLGMLRNMLK
jgi:LmbE family N-acetylglucosaminyl deacetylase